MPFKSVDPKPNFPKLEEEVLAQWDADHTFERSVNERPADAAWTFYDGPPFANGLPHYGHLLAGTMKDVIPRFWTMRGKRVRRVWGWDCHGLPVEFGVEKELGISGKKQIEEMGVETFNDACRADVLTYATEWRMTVRRMGRWVDFEHAYRTMDPDYMESIWWVVQQLWEKDLIYQGHRAMHICPRCSTPLSNFEVTQNYKDVTDLSVIATFPLVDEPDVSILAWTTTPWTLPGNVLLAVQPSAMYAEVASEGKRYILAEELVSKLFDGVEHEVRRTLPATEIIGKRYAPLFPFYADTANAFRVVAGDFVTLDDGTGVVHIAPAFGEDDYEVGRREGVSLVQHVEITGTFAPETDWLAGKDARGSDREITRHLEVGGRLFRTLPYTHSYPHCWRCETPLLNYAMAAWFVKVEHLRDTLVRTNEEIRWVPEHLKHGRFGKWLEGARDWNISRNRYWGTPLPIWVCACGHRLVAGSRDELVQRSNGAVTKDANGRYIFEGKELDLHKHIVDRIALTCERCNGAMTRTSEVLDCWFESGSMPYAERHYPFENAEDVEASYPADFIAEGLDQTRGWFYTLHVLAGALQLPGAPSPAFRNVVVNGLVLAEDGQKMSKSKKNYPDPNLLIDQYSADAIRYALMVSPAVRAEDLRFSERLVAEVVKSVHLPLWNTLSFLTTYAASARIEPTDALPPKLDHELDRWIVAEVDRLTRDVTASYDAYDLNGVSRPCGAFLDALTNWYVRRSRARFGLSADAEDRAQAFATLEHVLERLALLLAPVTPFLAEHVWSALGREGSVHLATWPTAPAPTEELDALIEKHATLRRIVALGHAVRSRATIPVRQPLARATIGLPTSVDAEELAASSAIIAEELNVIDVSFDAPEAIATRTVTPNPRVLGKRLGARVQDVIKAAKAGDFTLNDDGSVSLAGEELSAEEVDVGFVGRSGEAVASERGTVVALDTVLTPDLTARGVIRTLARAVNDVRKRVGLRVGQPAILRLSSPVLEDLLRDHAEYEEELRTRLSLSALVFGKTSDDAELLETELGKVWFVVEREEA